jgi:hypothetical protein
VDGSSNPFVLWALLCRQFMCCVDQPVATVTTMLLSSTQARAQAIVKRMFPPAASAPPAAAAVYATTNSYKKLAQDVQPGSSILCADGSIVLEVISTDPAAGTVRARCKNTAMLGERKNVNLPGVVVDLPTLTDKDVDDIVNWGVANEIDLIAASFVRKGSDLDLIRDVLGERGRYIKIISKVRGVWGVMGACSLQEGRVQRNWMDVPCSERAAAA